MNDDEALIPDQDEDDRTIFQTEEDKKKLEIEILGEQYDHVSEVESTVNDF